MNTVLKRVVAIAGLVFMVIGSILLIAASFDFSNNALALSAIIFLGAGLVCYIVILAFKGFPQQQLKEEQRRQIEEQYYKRLNEESVKTQEPALENSEQVLENSEETSEKPGEDLEEPGTPDSEKLKEPADLKQE